MIVCFLYGDVTIWSQSGVSESPAVDERVALPPISEADYEPVMQEEYKRLKAWGTAWRVTQRRRSYSRSINGLPAEDRCVLHVEPWDLREVVLKYEWLRGMLANKVFESGGVAEFDRLYGVRFRALHARVKELGFKVVYGADEVDTERERRVSAAMAAMGLDSNDTRAAHEEINT